MSKAQAKKIVKKYTTILKQEDFSFSRIYLYGSYAKNRAHTYSDIDVAVIQKRPSKNILENEMVLRELALDVDPRIEPYLLAEKELNAGESLMAREIKKYGIRVDEKV